MRTIPHSIISGLLALALTLTAAPAPALATAPDDIVFSQVAHGDDPGDSEDLPIPEEDATRPSPMRLLPPSAATPSRCWRTRCWTAAGWAIPRGY